MPQRVKFFHNIMPINNISSVIQYGILSHANAALLEHSDVSMSDIQDKRDQVQIPGGCMLHQYANVYFDARNPMMYKRINIVNQLCVLVISKDILNLEGVVITDQNAASDYVRFLSPDFIDQLDFDMIYADDWRHPDDQIAYFRHKSAKCAEVLVPNVIDAKYIKGAYVVNDEVKSKLGSAGFTLPIKCEPNLFFKG